MEVKMKKDPKLEKFNNRAKEILRNKGISYNLASFQNGDKILSTGGINVQTEQYRVVPMIMYAGILSVKKRIPFTGIISLKAQYLRAIDLLADITKEIRVIWHQVGSFRMFQLELLILKEGEYEAVLVLSLDETTFSNRGIDKLLAQINEREACHEEQCASFRDSTLLFYAKLALQKAFPQSAFWEYQTPKGNLIIRCMNSNTNSYFIALVKRDYPNAAEIIPIGVIPA